jgi:signal transduction histidine kinase
MKCRQALISPGCAGPQLSRWLVAWFAGFTLAGFAADAPPATPQLALLTRAEQVRALTPDQARRGHPVRLRAMVLDYNQTPFGYLMIRDETAGIYVDGAAGKGHRLRPGQWIDLQGVSGSGEFAPQVIASNITVVGEGSLPEGKPAAYDHLLTGVEDGQWVAVKGVIRAAFVEPHFDHERLLVELSTGGGRLAARVTQFDPANIDRLIDAEATITGVCFPLFNRKRQLLNVRLSVPGMSQIRIDQPPPDNPFAIVEKPIHSLMQFDPQGPHGHRVKVRGQVTLQQSGQSVFIKDAGQGLWVRTRQRTPLVPGDDVEVIGFPGRGEYSAVLEDATYRKTGHRPPPAPVALTVSRAREGNHDADLVQLDARLIEQSHSATEEILVLEEGNFIFRAHVAHSSPGAAPLAFELGSRLRLAGICVVQRGDQRWPQTFRLVLRSPADLAVLQLPPWWTFQRVLTALGLVTVILLAAMVWLVTLQRRVRAQTRIIREKLQREAVLEERTRIAREFHDTLEQELAGIGMQLETAAAKLDESPGLARRIFDVAQSMLRHTRSEARRSVWELRARALQEGNLAGALEAVAHYVQNGSPVHIAVQVSGPPQPLPVRVESNLLRIGQEAVANAMKHAHPKNLRVDLRYDPATVRLSVEDDGCGLPPDQTPGPDSGHFGLLGMRERAGMVGGHLEISSVPGRGTKIQVSVPLAQTTCHE